LNINTTKSTPSFVDYVIDEVKCDNTAWVYKFTTSWNDCNSWGANTYFSIKAQVYEFNIEFLPKDTKFKFLPYVKSYTPEMFSSFVFNRIERPAINVKDFIVGDTFTLNQDINNTTLKFYLSPDIKLTKSSVLNKYRVFFSRVLYSISIHGECITRGYRYINPSFNFSTKLQTNIYADRYINPFIDFSLYSLVYVYPNCKATYWSRKFNVWKDCNVWSFNCNVDFWTGKPDVWKYCDIWDTNCKTTYWYGKFDAWRDCGIWSSSCGATSWLGMFNEWKDCNNLGSVCKATYWSGKPDEWEDCNVWSLSCDNTSWIGKFNKWNDCNVWSVGSKETYWGGRHDVWNDYYVWNLSCKMKDWEGRFDDWGDCSIWDLDCKTTSWIGKFIVWGDCKIWS
jgi:hypothetical protein